LTPDSPRTGSHRRLIALAIVLVLAGVALLFRMSPKHPAEEQELADRQIPERPAPESRFQNSSPAAKFIGSQRCAECHAEQFESWRQTSHSLALSELNLAQEPPDVTFDHALSNRRFRVVRREGTMFHEESFITHDGEEVPVHSFPVAFVVGSGNHSKSYLIERDGFYVESPITWYSRTNSWGISPGYDLPAHNSFERVVNFDCMNCHSGKVEQLQSPFRLHFTEMAVSCERCHGPGELHAKLHETARAATDAADLTIVNPAHLDRELSESICSDCHLSGDAWGPVPGRREEDYRPGLRLVDFRHEYRFAERAGAEQGMKVTGHVDQMRESLCWKMSESFTCTTCHDPHRPLQESEKLEWYRRVCSDCHSCRVEETVRKERVADDSCITCHMPRTATDIPHFTFTHHRVGIFNEPPAAPSKALPAQGTLVPVHDLSSLSEAERDYSLGLALIKVSTKTPNDPAALHYRQQGVERLQQLIQQGYRNQELSEMTIELDVEAGQILRAAELSQQLLEKPQLDAWSRIRMLTVHSRAMMQTNRFAEAIDDLTELTKLRFEAEDWVMLGLCQQNLGNHQRAIEAVEKALEIDPSLGGVHQFLAVICDSAGQFEKARYHRELGRKFPLYGFETVPELQR
jgi:Tetratricopeptide repeat/Cytochrome c554 and c-prime